MTDIVQVRIVEGGVVVNLTKADRPYAESKSAEGWVISDVGDRGDIWDGTVFAPPPAS